MSYGNIEHPAAYEAAIAARIRAATFKKYNGRFLAVEGNLEIVNFVLANNGSFFNSLAHSYNQYGSLTVGQVNAVRKIIADRASKVAARRALDSGSVHISTVGKRAIFTVSVVKILSFEGDYGTVYINILKDSAGNVVIYKGASLANANVTEGDTVTIKATVKAHEEREGVKQTILARPVVLSIDTVAPVVEDASDAAVATVDAVPCADSYEVSHVVYPSRIDG